MFARYKRAGEVDAMRVDAMEDRGVEGAILLSGKVETKDGKEVFVESGRVQVGAGFMSQYRPGVGSFVVRDGSAEWCLSAEAFARSYSPASKK